MPEGTVLKLASLIDPDKPESQAYKSVKHPCHPRNKKKKAKKDKKKLRNWQEAWLWASSCP